MVFNTFIKKVIEMFYILNLVQRVLTCLNNNGYSPTRLFMLSNSSIGTTTIQLQISKHANQTLVGWESENT